jgi:two-component system LytT family sensor kinase
MKKIILIFLTLTFAMSSVNAQKGIDFSYIYAAGGKLRMCVDSAAKNVHYDNIFPNQPNNSFNYLPDVHNLYIQINFRKNESVQDYRYTILVDDRPIEVNKSINKAQIKNIKVPYKMFSSAGLGIFSIKGKTITTLVYSIEKPQDIYKSVFYGKPIPKAKIKFFSKLVALDRGFGSQTDFNERKKFHFNKEDKELIIVKDKSAIDYIYYTSIKDKKTNKIIFRSTAWQYGHYVDSNAYLPHIGIDKNVFKKSGEYEIIIQPNIRWNISLKEKEKYTTKHTITITLAEENYTKKELFIIALIVAFAIGLIFLVIIYITKKINNKKLSEKEQQKNTAKLQLNSIRSQLNPHFLFNALSGIQNLMNKNEIDNANKYLSKFARLTRNVLDDKELISLSQEKTLLDDYLQMEQLRFGFEYEINTSENIDLENIEIPSMLLQPFVENAVKHGIAKKAIDGKIAITFVKQAHDLVLTVTDNGNGFDTTNKKTGLGLPLSQSRIELLNNIYKENRFTLVIQSSTTGTKISLTLTDWL